MPVWRHPRSRGGSNAAIILAGAMDASLRIGKLHSTVDGATRYWSQPMVTYRVLMELDDQNDFRRAVPRR